MTVLEAHDQRAASKNLLADRDSAGTHVGVKTKVGGRRLLY